MADSKALYWVIGFSLFALFFNRLNTILNLIAIEYFDGNIIYTVYAIFAGVGIIFLLIKWIRSRKDISWSGNNA